MLSRLRLFQTFSVCSTIAVLSVPSSGAAAQVLRDRALSFVETTLVAHPLIGRPGRVDGTRESVIHPSYIIVYRVTAEVVEILTVRHVAQKWPDQF